MEIQNKEKVTQNVNYIKLLLTKWKGIETVQKINIYRLLSVDVKKQDAENLSVGDKILMEYLNKTKSSTKVIPCEITKVTKKKKIIYHILHTELNYLEIKPLKMSFKTSFINEISV